MYNQMYPYFNPYFNPIFLKSHSGFRPEHSSQKSLLHMIEKWRACAYNGQIVGAILTDLSKTFDCINHNLLTAKFAAYGFS